MLDTLGLPFSAYWLAKAKGQNFCPRCEGDGSHSALQDCTTWGPDCACNGPSVNVDPCELCGGSGEWPATT